MLFKFYSRFDENKDLFKQNKCEASKENIFVLGSWQEKENETLKKKEEKEALNKKKKG